MAPSVIAREIAIDLVIGPWTDANYDVFTGVEGHVAPLRASSADTGRLVQLPCPRLVKEVFRDERAHRAEIDHVPRPWMIQHPVRMNADKGPITPLAHVQNVVVRNVVHELHAPRAQDAPVRYVENVATKVLDRIESLGVAAVSRSRTPFLKDVILELALPAWSQIAQSSG